ncbi:MAG: ATP-grasp domain-containing protein [Candidatus Omnitrophota bacterium]|nr:ATP-grasp domain-containing protein [Candidatus Omnitrophota bacterium]
MKKKEKRTTILVIGDEGDFDTYRKFEKEGRFILKTHFDFKNIHYKDLLKRNIPEIGTEKVIIFFFFPFIYWNKNIEHPRYRGIYGNHTFYRKFNRFARMIVKIIKDSLPEKDILLVNNPMTSSFYRDKVTVMKTLSKAGIVVPPLFKVKRVRDIKKLLKKGHKFFIKPRCGSMGKGITFLQLGNWQSNFSFKNNRIISRKSDYGWKFRDMTGNSRFLRALLHSKDVFMEEAIEPLSIKDERVDFRVYGFLNKVMYVYPRRNSIDSVTTNISQGGYGDPGILEIIPEKLQEKVKKIVKKAMKTLDIKFAGIDVIVDSSLQNLYIVDVNMFPGLPKRKTFNLAREVIKDLKRHDGKGTLRYTRGKDISLG